MQAGRVNIPRRCRTILKQTLIDDNFVEIQIGKRPIRALLDTGSCSSIINAALARRLRLSVNPVERNGSKVLFMASGSRMTICGTTEIPISFTGVTHVLTISHTFKVIDDVCHDLILGVDFMKQNHVVIDYNQSCVSVADDLLKLPLQSRKQQQACATVNQTICIPAQSEMILSVTCPQSFNGQTVLVEGLPGVQFKAFAVARSLSQCDQGQMWIRILNFIPFAIVLKRKE